MKRGLVILSVLAIIVSTSSAAIQQGEYEIGFLMKAAKTNYTGSGDRNIFALDLDTAYFVTDNLSLGLDIGGDWREGTSSVVSSRTDQYYYGVKGKYHFYTQNQLVPYFGLMAGLADVKIEVSSTSSNYSGHYFGGLLGGRYELNRSNDLYMELQYKLYGGGIKDDLGFDKETKLLIGILHQFD